MEAILALALATVAFAAAVPATHAVSCPADLSGYYTAPALIVPVDSANPDYAFGTQYVANVSDTADTLFLFNLPSSYLGMICSLVLLLPATSDVECFSGNCTLNTTLLQNQVTTSTTWNTKGPVYTNSGDMMATVQKGGSFSLGTFPCPAGYQLTFDVGSADGKTNLTWFETTQDQPTGLWMRAC